MLHVYIHSRIDMESSETLAKMYSDNEREMAMLREKLRQLEAANEDIQRALPLAKVTESKSACPPQHEAFRKHRRDTVKKNDYTCTHCGGCAFCPPVFIECWDTHLPKQKPTQGPLFEAHLVPWK